jgi:hypothetical protein
VTTTNPSLRRLRRIRWAVRATLTFGVAASVAANILHAQRNPISETIAAWPPLALLLTIELVSRVPVHRFLLAAPRVLATVVISGIAAWVSYWHMAGVTSRYGETGASPYLLPISVDGLIVVASVSLVELAARIRTFEDAPPTAATPPLSTLVAAPRASDVDGVAAAGTITVPVPTPMAPPDDPVLDPVVVFDDEDQAVTDDLIDRARSVVADYRTATGRDITRDQLRAQLRVSNATAGELLRRIRLIAPARPAITGPVTAPGRATAAIGDHRR